MQAYEIGVFERALREFPDFVPGNLALAFAEISGDDCEPDRGDGDESGGGRE